MVHYIGGRKVQVSGTNSFTLYYLTKCKLEVLHYLKLKPPALTSNKRFELIGKSTREIGVLQRIKAEIKWQLW